MEEEKKTFGGSSLDGNSSAISEKGAKLKSRRFKILTKRDPFIINSTKKVLVQCFPDHKSYILKNVVLKRVLKNRKKNSRVEYFIFAATRENQDFELTNLSNPHKALDLSYLYRYFRNGGLSAVEKYSTCPPQYFNRSSIEHCVWYARKAVENIWSSPYCQSLISRPLANCLSSLQSGLITLTSYICEMGSGIAEEIAMLEVEIPNLQGLIQDWVNTWCDELLRHSRECTDSVREMARTGYWEIKMVMLRNIEDLCKIYDTYEDGPIQTEFPGPVDTMAMTSNRESESQMRIQQKLLERKRYWVTKRVIEAFKYFQMTRLGAIITRSWEPKRSKPVYKHGLFHSASVENHENEYRDGKIETWLLPSRPEREVRRKPERARWISDFHDDGTRYYKIAVGTFDIGVQSLECTFRRIGSESVQPRQSNTVKLEVKNRRKYKIGKCTAEGVKKQTQLVRAQNAPGQLINNATPFPLVHLEE